MSDSYCILKRKDRFKIENSYDYYIPERDMDFPLCGFSDYKQDLCAGDFIGVILKSDTQIETEFSDIDCEIINESLKSELKELYPKKLKYNVIEEHFFQITKLNENKEFSVFPVFIDNKIISKKINLSESEIKVIPTDLIDKEKCLDNFSFWEALGFKLFNFGCVKKFTNKLEKYIQSNETLKSQYKFFINKEDYLKLPDVERNKAICIPYENYKNYVFNLENKEDIKYFEFLNANLELLVRLFGEEVKIKLGTPEILIQNSEEIINSAFNKEISFRINYHFIKNNELDFPKISKHEIDNVHFSNIYRVFKTNPKFIGKSLKNSYLRDWSGREISNEILQNLQEKNFIRIVISGVADKGWFNTYFQILKKVGENSYLVCSDDPYIHELEDVLFVVNSDVINEIPLDWEGNENLKEKVEYVADEAQENKDFDSFCDFNYDGLLFG